MRPKPFEITLGPLLFNWPPERTADFYARMADEAPIDRVYLGEVVCGKREPLLQHTLAEAAYAQRNQQRPNAFCSSAATSACTRPFCSPRLPV